MYLFVVEATYAPPLDIKGELGVQKLIANPSRLGVLVDACTRSPIERIAIRLGRS